MPFKQRYRSREAASVARYTLSESITLNDDLSREGTPKGSVWDVTVISVGKSKNVHRVGNVSASFYYSQEALERSAGIFEGAQVYAHRSGPHAEEKPVVEIVGWLTEPVVESGRIRAKLNFLPSAAWLRENLLLADEKNVLDKLYRLSIDGGGKAYLKEHGGEQVLWVESIDHLDGVAVVPRDGAGGGFNKLLESHTSHHKGVSPMKPIMVKLLTLFTLGAYLPFLESKRPDWQKIDENELFTYLLEADRTQSRFSFPDGAQLSEQLIDEKIAAFYESTEAGHTGRAHAALDARLSEGLDPLSRQLNDILLQGRRAILAVKLQESRLPKPLKDDLTEQFKDRVFKESELDNAIRRARETWAKLVPANADNRGLDIHLGQDGKEKIELGILGLFLESSQALKPLTADERRDILRGVPAYRSIREAYIDFTGDVNVTGLKKYSTRMRESLDTTSWGEVLADAIHKRMVRDYSTLNLENWRLIADVVPISDFKTQHRVRWGGYPNLPVRPQGAAYLPLSSPTDEGTTYTPKTRGGTEDVTREMIMNDDIGEVNRIPKRLARAAAQTLHEFVWDFINPAVNPAVYDNVALYHNDHANTGATALAGATLAAARLRMRKQVMMDNEKRLGLRLRYLVVPSDLEETAYGLVTPAYDKSNAVPTHLQSIGIVPIVVEYWTDANNWCVVADKLDVTGIEIGFLNGQETPELFVSDVNNAGSWFTNDTLTMKIRHEYGGAILDYRAFDGSVVP